MNSNLFALRLSLLASAAAFVGAVAPSSEALAQADIGAVTVVARHAKPKKTKKAPSTAHRGAQRVALSSRGAGGSHAPARVASGVAPTGSSAPASQIPIASDAAIGSKAPPGSAPALSPSQAPLDSFEPGSVVSDKIIQDVIAPGSDFNDVVKFTPGFYNSNSNGSLGDSKGGWRGFKDGQYNITFDGIPFGDANDPSHHSAAYFPSSFLGKVVLDRGPGAASQVGYATFGGTLGMFSHELKDEFGGNVQSSYGNFSTFVTSTQVQSGYIKETGTRALFEYSHAQTAGAQQYGNVETNQFLGKVERQFEGVTATLFGTYGREHYDNVISVTYPQLYAGGYRYGGVSGNPLTQQYVGYNNSEKQTDLEYVKLKGDAFGFHFEDKVYTYSYWYPSLQNNGADQTIEGLASVANKGTIQNVSVPTASGGKTSLGFNVPNGDVTGYVKYNNYRAWGNIFDVSRDFEAGLASGTLHTGVWWERVDNWRYQEYIDYTTGTLYPYLAKTAQGAYQGAYKLDLGSHIQNVQPFVEYEWRPIDGLSITPGFKFESFTRNQTARINQTTISPQYFEKTYTASLPFFAVRYKVTPEVTVYGQASRGFLAPTVSAYYVLDPTQNNIQPQTTTNFQLGAVYKSEALTADIDVYQITANNFPVTNTTTTGLTTYQNGGTARYRGVEAQATYKIIQGLAAYASGAVSDARYLEGQFSGLYVGNAPRYTVAGGFIYDDGTFFGSLLHKVTGDQWGAQGQRSATSIYTGVTNPYLNYIPAYHTTDLVVGARGDYFRPLGFGNKVEIKFGITNLFDNHGVTDIGGKPDGLTSIANTTLTYSFQAGRIIYGGLKVDF
ncbi:MAG TPA: TonB-dependent receptor [Methylosinus sp.]|jgi:iron complex outermembrane receptor protein|uniref:TonB-dependent receptor n=1 Tax=Methylosinus sp. TaxID=427 RepID=UPI002F91F315